MPRCVTAHAGDDPSRKWESRAAAVALGPAASAAPAGAPLRALVSAAAAQRRVPAARVRGLLAAWLGARAAEAAQRFSRLWVGRLHTRVRVPLAPLARLARVSPSALRCAVLHFA